MKDGRGLSDATEEEMKRVVNNYLHEINITSLIFALTYYHGELNTKTHKSDDDKKYKNIIKMLEKAIKEKGVLDGI